jgi:SAM-dependent methyltransferase
VKEKTLDKDKVLSANRVVHAFLADSGEYEKSPHFRQENQEKVSSILKRLTKRLNKKVNLLDLGCGTGFIPSLSHSLFEHIVGVDITEEMMKKVDLSPGNISLYNCVAENTPFDDGSFDMVTAYSFLDHLIDYTAVLKEAHRVLSNGGIFYADLNPNRAFISEMEELLVSDGIESLSPLLKRELNGALNNGDYYEDKYGLDSNTLQDAEPGKTLGKGFDANEVADIASHIGFSKVEIEFEWFVDQGHWVNQEKNGNSEIVERYLQSLLPSTSRYYKYLRFIFVK